MTATYPAVRALKMDPAIRSPLSRNDHLAPASVSEEIIAAVRGEFYAYRAVFSTERPLYFLMKCKSNKSRPLSTDARSIRQELDLTFVFGGTVMLCSPDSEGSLALLRGVVVDPQSLRRSELRPTSMTEDGFRDACLQKDEASLVAIHRAAAPCRSTLALRPGLTVSVKTDSGKYGLIRVAALTPSTCHVEACHVLL